LTNRVTNRQIIFILILTLSSYSIVDISRAMAASAGYGSWLTILVTAIFFTVIAIINLSLGNKFKGQMLFDYSKHLVGKFGSYTVTIYYIIYFSIIIVFLSLQLSIMLKANFLPKTPKAATLIVGIPVFCFIAYKGITTLARLFELIGIFYIIIGVSVQVLMVTQGKLENILPFFNIADIGEYIGAIKEAIFPFLGIEVLLVIPLTKENGKKATITAAVTVFVIGLLYIFFVESTIMKLGMNNIVHYNSSLIVAIRDMELPFLDFMKRADVLFLTFGFAAFFLGITMVYTAITEYLCKMFTHAKRSYIVIIIGILSYAACLIFDNDPAFNKFVTGVGIYLGLVASAVLPTILLIIAKVKKNVL
jgi:spore germination protein